jgi:hypothetical protein
VLFRFGYHSYFSGSELVDFQSIGGFNMQTIYAASATGRAYNRGGEEE